MVALVYVDITANRVAGCTPEGVVQHSTIYRHDSGWLEEHASALIDADPQPS